MWTTYRDRTSCCLIISYRAVLRTVSVCESWVCVWYFYFHRCHWESVFLVEAAGQDSRRERSRDVCRWRELVAPRSPGSTSAEAGWKTLLWTAGTILSEEIKDLRYLPSFSLLYLRMYWGFWWIIMMLVYLFIWPRTLEYSESNRCHIQ